MDGEAFGIEGQLAVGDRDVGEATEGRGRRVDRRGGGAIEVRDLRGALKSQRELGLADGVGRVVGREGEFELLDTGGVVDQASDVVTAVGQGVEHASVGTISVFAPGRRIDLEGGERSERVAEAVNAVGDVIANTDETLVQVSRAIEGDGLRIADGCRVDIGRRVSDRAGGQRDGGGGGEESSREVTHRVCALSRH